MTLAELAIYELLKRREENQEQTKDLLTQNHRKGDITTSRDPDASDVRSIPRGEVLILKVEWMTDGGFTPPGAGQVFTRQDVIPGPVEISNFERVATPSSGNTSPEGVETKQDGYRFYWFAVDRGFGDMGFVGSSSTTTPSDFPYGPEQTRRTLFAEIEKNGVTSPYPIQFGDLNDSAPSAFGAPLRVFEPDPSPAPEVAPAPSVPSIAPARAPVQPAPAPAPGEAQPAPSDARARTAVTRAPAPSAPKVPSNAESMGENAQLQPKPTPPPPPTPPGTTFLPGGVSLPNNGPRPTPAGTSSELGKLEKKLELALAPEGPLSLIDKFNKMIDEIENIKFLLDNLFPPEPYQFSEGQYQLSPVCERDTAGQPLPPRIAPWPSGEGEITEVNNKLDALAELIQFHKELKQPTCKGPAPIGEGVTVTFEEIQE